MKQPRIFEIVYPDGAVPTATQIATCIFGMTKISATVTDITTYVQRLENPIKEEPIRHIPKEEAPIEQRTADRTDQQKTGQPTSVPHGGQPKVDGDQNPADRKPIT